MTVSKKQIDQINNWKKANVKRIGLELDKSYFENIIRPHCEKYGLPINTFIKQAIAEKLRNDLRE